MPGTKTFIIVVVFLSAFLKLTISFSFLGPSNFHSIIMGRKNKYITVNNNKGKGLAAHCRLEHDPNFVFEAGPGCHIARKQPATKTRSSPKADWVLEWEEVDPADFDDQEVPDVAVDPDDQTLTLCNIRDHQIVAYVTVYDLKLRDKHDRILQQGSTTDNDGNTRVCTTLIVVCPPKTFAHLCTVDTTNGSSSIQDWQELPLDSDISVYVPHPNANDTHQQSIAFPLEGGPFLCTQGEDGVLTHFLVGNLHAIDFQCPVETPLLAVGDGVVVDVQDGNKNTGIAVNNLYHWNSIMLQIDNNDGSEDGDPLFIEYVHVQSSLVKKGDRVTCGQIIGSSGGVGFSPEPHLHLAAYRSSKATAPTVRVMFRSNKAGTTYLPRAGNYYDANGEVQP